MVKLLPTDRQDVACEFIGIGDGYAYVTIFSSSYIELKDLFKSVETLK